MLSILIPTYNYNAFPLVSELWKQANDAGIIFEIIVLDDGSTNTTSITGNLKINELEFAQFEQNQTNLGRAKTRNLLAQKAKYNWLLFMDSDTFPKNESFLSNYLKAIDDDKNEIIFGGINYKKEKPEISCLLRWKYGSEREEISVQDRIQNPYLTTLTSNIVVKKVIFNTVTFDERIAEYGYEDLIFIQNLKNAKLVISHIDNATFHLNYETSVAFLAKTRKALETLQFIEEQNILESIETKIQKTYHFVDKLQMCKFISFVFKKLRHQAEKNLFSDNPSLLIFDLYKLGYFCLIKTV